MNFYNDDELYDIEWLEKKKELRDSEIVKWKLFLQKAKPSQVKTLIEEALVQFEAGDVWKCDHLLMDNYNKIIAKSPETESWIEETFGPLNHPLHSIIFDEIAISKRQKPKVGDLIPRHMNVIGEPDGTYKVTPVQPTSELMMRVSKNSLGRWAVVNIRSPGLVVCITEKPRPNWSHLEITSVGPRTCKAIPRYTDFEDRVKKAALSFHKVLGRHGKVKIIIEW